jgi:BolA protein
MTDSFTGPLAAEIEKRLRGALAPSHLEVRNDSALHQGHAGDDGSGESHFFVDVTAERFAGMSRVERQRAVTTELADLLQTRIHALAMRVRAPGE